MDEVSELDWARFNNWISEISDQFRLLIVDCKSKTISEIDEVSSVLSSYEDSMQKESSIFSKFVLPELGCAITEEWDYTYIIWYKDSEKIVKLFPSIEKAGLKHFHD